MRISFLSLLLLLFLSVISHPCFSCFIYIEAKEFAKSCPVILSGKIVRIEVTPSVNGASQVIAYIKISKIHKNILKDVGLTIGEEFPVYMSAIHSNYEDSTEIRYCLDTQGIWLITLDENGLFRINSHPVQYQCSQKEKELKKNKVFRVDDRKLRKEGCTSQAWIEMQKTSAARVGRN